MKKRSFGGCFCIGIFSSKVFDEETGLYYYGYRYYSPELGRWISRDPLGEDGGLNLYSFVHNNSINKYDNLGLYTIQEALLLEFPQGLPQPPNKDDYSLDAIRDRARWYKENRLTPQQIFDIWYKWEKTRGSWWKSLPKCPKKLCLEEKNGKKTPKNPDSSKWKNPGEIIKPHVERFHPGAFYEMRSHGFGNNSNQCTYDSDGNVITNAPAMGTVDSVCPSTGGRLSHWNEDVATVILSAKLDGKWNPAILNDPLVVGTLFGFIIPNTAGRIIGVGPNMLKYYEVRPSYAE